MRSNAICSVIKRTSRVRSPIGTRVGGADLGEGARVGGGDLGEGGYGGGGFGFARGAPAGGTNDDRLGGNEERRLVTRCMYR